MQGGILTPPFAIITYAVLLNYQSLPRDPAPGPAAAPAGDTSGPTPHSSARSGRSPWRPARSPRLLPPLSAQYAWCRRHTASPCRSSPGRRVYALGQQLLQLIEEQPLVAGFAKQLVVPLWQVGPIGFTSTSSVSLSQSGVMLTTLRTWPEVSPLVHSRCLVRE